MRRLHWTLVVLAAFAVVTLTGQSCARNTGIGASTQRTITVWGLWHESRNLRDIIKAFSDQTGTKVQYKKIASVAAYERELLSALAEGRGPDVFVIHHTWVDGKRGILAAAPNSIVDPRAVQDEFVDVVAKDVVRDGQVYALPVSVDTLAMYYNKDLFNAAGIAKPPETWTDFQRMVEKLTTVNRLGTIQQSAAAIGTAENVNRAPDIVQLLMMQSGLPIINERGNVDVSNADGERSLAFYTDFANRGKKVYTWNLQQDFSIDAFAEGDTAVMFNYSYHIPTIRAKNPRLNFGIAHMPQIAGSAVENHSNFAAYWPYAVANASTSPNAAWQFVRFVSSQSAADDINTSHTTPPALRSSVIESQRDPELGVFADQALTAKSWSRPDIAAADSIFNQAIDDVVTGASTANEALRRAEDQLNRL